MKYVLLVNVTEKDVKGALLRTFDNEFEMKILSDVVITNYGDAKQIEKLQNDINRGTIELATKLKDGDEVYVLLVGGLLNNYLLIERLKELEIPFKLLVYEKKLKRYVILEAGNGKIHVA